MRIEINDAGWPGDLDLGEHAKRDDLRVFCVNENDMPTIEVAKWDNGIAVRTFGNVGHIAVRISWAVFDGLCGSLTFDGYERMVRDAHVQGTTVVKTW